MKNSNTTHREKTLLAEHAEQETLSLERRSFLKLVGFSLGAAGLASCSRGPVQNALTLLHPNENIVAGRSYWIATTSWADGSGSGILARCVDGRPIKLEGNPEHPVNQGGLSASVQASLLSLYDDHRFDGARIEQRQCSWEELDRRVQQELETIRAKNGRVRLLSSTITGPSTLAWIQKFLGSFSDGKHVVYDALSCSALLDACEVVYGQRALPRYRLDKTQALASFDADFLGAWISPAGFTKDWASARKPDDAAAKMSRVWQFESRLSLSGARADRRVMLAPWEIPKVLAFLAGEIATKSGAEIPGPLPSKSSFSLPLQKAVGELVQDLWNHRGESLVLSGRNDLESQVLCCWINEMLGAPGKTLDLESPSLQKRGDDKALASLREELLRKEVDLLLIADCNPAYDLPDFVSALKAARLSISFSALPDETSNLTQINCPQPHELERWDDGEPFAGILTTTQPTIPILRSTRTLRCSIARWLGDRREDRLLLEDHWRGEFAKHPTQDTQRFETWFTKILEQGWVFLPWQVKRTPSAFRKENLRPALERIASGSKAENPGKFRLVLYPKVGLLDGRGAHNPWLQELPDPITKTVWDNHADFAPATAAKLGIRSGDLVRLSTETGLSVEVPALVQPGQDERIVALALGYGRLGTDRFTKIGPQWLEAKPTVRPGGLVGVNGAPFLELSQGTLSYDTRSVSVQRSGAHQELACTQDHHSLSVPAHLAPKGGEVRDAVQTLAFVELQANPKKAIEKKHGSSAELWADDHKSEGPLWGMAIDLASCTGCSACVVGCQAENNVPVVGRDEVQRHREMSWIRIDRYYEEEPNGGVQVRHQPMMCQHCGHAPCETVCPVLATVHSADGLNQQVYNRCVGTRYCANNCPYKVRRFNWFEYARENQLQNLSLNPEVTIRSKGVMEKCSLCIQRIQDAKVQAKRDGVALRDGQIQTACQQSCPANAIVFGDFKDPKSQISQWISRPRSYEVLGELNVQASVRYLADVRHMESKEGQRHG